MQKIDRSPFRVLHGCLLAGAALITGCPNNELAPIEPCTISGVADSVNRDGVDEVDLLFMIDNSGSMKEEQELLAEQLPILARVLAAGELQLENGEKRTFTPVRSLHLGVISSDMGLSGAPAFSTCESMLGDDGVLRVGGLEGCTLTTVENGNHLNFTKGQTDVAALGDEFACISKLGTSGCGLEQQLESMLKAVAPSSDKSFSGGTSGHGDGVNAGFLRQGSVIALIAVTDEEDCSIPDSSNDVFAVDPKDPRFIASNSKAIGVNPRCALFSKSELLHPVARYVKGFQDLRLDHPDLVIFGAIAGVPVDAERKVRADGVQDFDAILALDEMQITFDGDTGITPANIDKMTDRAGGPLPDPACLPNAGTDPDSKGASPARRFVEVAKAFGKNGIIRSICANDFGSAMNAIIDKIANQLTGACLDRTLNPNDQGIVECDIVEYLPVGMTECDPTKGRTPAVPAIRKGEDGLNHTVCKIAQVAVDKSKQGCTQGTQDPFACLAPNPTPGASQELVGWYYDDFTAELQTSCVDQATPQRVGFTPNAEPPLGAQVQFECLQPVFTVFGDPAGKDTVNKICKGEPFRAMSLADLASEKGISADCTSDEQYPAVRCQPTTNTCQIMCSADANCPDSWVCNKAAGEQVGFCVNPTCPR